MATKIYRSNDEGRSWSYLSEIRAAKPGGVWEPEFTVGRDGALILFFSDETDQVAPFADHQEGENLRRASLARHGYVVASDVQHAAAAHGDAT